MTAHCGSIVPTLMQPTTAHTALKSTTSTYEPMDLKYISSIVASHPFVSQVVMTARRRGSSCGVFGEVIRWKITFKNVLKVTIESGLDEARFSTSNMGI